MGRVQVYLLSERQLDEALPPGHSVRRLSQLFHPPLCPSKTTKLILTLNANHTLYFSKKYITNVLLSELLELPSIARSSSKISKSGARNGNVHGDVEDCESASGSKVTDEVDTIPKIRTVNENEERNGAENKVEYGTCFGRGGEVEQVGYFIGNICIAIGYLLRKLLSLHQLNLHISLLPCCYETNNERIVNMLNERAREIIWKTDMLIPYAFSAQIL
jgi:hypothetical protein